MPRKTYQKGGMSTGKIIGIVVICAIAVSLVAVAFLAGTRVLNGANPLSANTYELNNLGMAAGVTNAQGVATSGSNEYSIQGPVTFYVDNSLTGALLSSFAGTVNVYAVGNYATTVASVTISSGTGSTTGSSNLFTSGQQYEIHVAPTSGTTYGNVWSLWTVPEVTGITTTTITAPVGINVMPTYSVSLQDGNGKQYASSGTWNITTGASPGYSTGILDLQVRNTASNTNFIESTDPIYNVQYQECLLVTVTGTGWGAVGISGNSAYAGTKGTTEYYVYYLNPTDMQRTTTGYTSSGGFEDLSQTISVSGLSSNTATITAQVYVFSSPTEFQSNNDNFGTTSAAMGSAVTWTVTA